MEPQNTHVSPPSACLQAPLPANMAGLATACTRATSKGDRDKVQ